MLTSITRAVGIQRTEIAPVFRIADADNARCRKEGAVARVSRRHHAIKHINATLHAVNQVFRGADSH